MDKLKECTIEELIKLKEIIRSSFRKIFNLK